MDKKIKCLVFVAILLAIIGIVLPESITSGVLWVNNNTNLAPTFPGEPVGTGERVQNVTYWSNNSPIDLYVFGHGSSAGTSLSLILYVNGTILERDQRRPLGVAEESYGYIKATIPQYANYSVNITGSHHYEWREHPILTGNVSTVVTSSGGGGGVSGCVGNCSFDNLSINVLSKNDTTNPYGVYIHLLEGFRHTVETLTDTFITFNGNAGGDWLFLKTEDLVTLGYSQILLAKNQIIMDVVGLTKSSRFLQAEDFIYLLIDGTLYNFNNTHLDLGGANLTNCANCVNTTDLNLKVNKSGNENITGPINITDGNLSLEGVRSHLNLYTAGIDYTRNNIMYLNATIGTSAIRMQTAGVSRNTRYGTTFNGAGAVSIHQFALNQTGTNYSNGDGAAFLVIMTDNQRQNNAIGKLGLVYDNITNNQGKVVLNPRFNASDTAQNVPSVEVWGSDQRMQINSGNLVIKGAGRGITMNSSNNNQWCVTVTNAGVLNVAAGACA